VLIEIACGSHHAIVREALRPQSAWFLSHSEPRYCCRSPDKPQCETQGLMSFNSLIWRSRSTPFTTFRRDIDPKCYPTREGGVRKYDQVRLLRRQWSTIDSFHIIHPTNLNRKFTLPLAENALIGPHQREMTTRNCLWTHRYCPWSKGIAWIAQLRLPSIFTTSQRSNNSIPYFTTYFNKLLSFQGPERDRQWLRVYQKTQKCYLLCSRT
jgi:hypothetical protein